MVVWKVNLPRAFVVVLVLGVAAAAAGAAEEAPSAYQLLDRLTDGYANRPSYQDSGILEVREGPRLIRRWAFETLSYNGAFRFLLSKSGVPGRGVWIDGGGGTWIFDHRRGTRKAEAKVGTELYRLLDVGPDALLVPLLLVERGELLLAPEAASLDGPESCSGAPDGPAQCWRLQLTRLAGTVEMELWVEREEALIHRLEVRLLSQDEVLRRALAGEGDLAAGSGGAPVTAPTVITATFDVSRVEEPLPPERLAFRPPEGEAGLAERYGGQEPDSLVSFDDEISVGLVEATVRVLDRNNRAIAGLTEEDFRVTVARQEVPVRSVDWVSTEEPELSDIPPEVLERYGIVVPPPGRLMILFVQASLEPSRVTGQMQMLREAERFLETLHPDDHLAVVSFDSSLKLRLDFTRDRSGVEEAFNRAMRVGKQERWKPGEFPSLARYLDYDEARKAAVAEEGLAVVGRALRRLPGEKVMLYMGYGLGNFVGGSLRLGRDYGEAVAALRASETTVFTVDVTQADFHTLEGGIQQVAANTGGEYLRLYTTGPGQVVKRLQRSLVGYYLVTFDAPRKDKRQRIKIELVGKKGRVLTRDEYVHPAR